MLWPFHPSGFIGMPSTSTIRRAGEDIAPGRASLATGFRETAPKLDRTLRCSSKKQIVAICLGITYFDYFISLSLPHQRSLFSHFSFLFTGDWFPTVAANLNIRSRVFVFRELAVEHQRSNDDQI